MPKSKMLILLRDAFGGHGGIAQFNRDFIEAIIASRSVDEICVLPRLISSEVERLPRSIAYDHEAAGGKFAFVKRALTHMLRSDQIHFVICGHIHLLPVAWLVARKHKAPLALVVHGIEAWQPSKGALANRLARRVDQAIAVSSLTAERFSSWSKLPSQKMFILPNCVDLDRFKPRDPDESLIARYGLQDSRVILTIGRLASEGRRKGFDEVIDAMPPLLSRFPDLKYLIVGDGPDLSRLKEKVAAQGLSDAVVFAGYVPEAEKVAHYSVADAFVLPSAGEGFGIVLIEAAACGIPVIGSRADGSREALLDGALGALVNPRKPHELAEAIIKVLDRPTRRARHPAIDTFSVSNFRSRVAKWLPRICGDLA